MGRGEPQLASLALDHLKMVLLVSQLMNPLLQVHAELGCLASCVLLVTSN